MGDMSCKDMEISCDIPVCDRDPGRFQCSDRGCDARDDLIGDSCLRECLDLLAASPKDEGISTF